MNYGSAPRNPYTAGAFQSKPFGDSVNSKGATLASAMGPVAGAATTGTAATYGAGFNAQANNLATAASYGASLAQTEAMERVEKYKADKIAAYQAQQSRGGLFGGLLGGALKIGSSLIPGVGPLVSAGLGAAGATIGSAAGSLF